MQLLPQLADAADRQIEAPRCGLRALAGRQDLGNPAISGLQGVEPVAEIDPRGGDLGGASTMIFNYDLVPVTDLIDLGEALHLDTMATLTASRRNITNIQTVADRSSFANASHRVGGQGRGIDQICAAEITQPHEGSPGMGNCGIHGLFTGLRTLMTKGHTDMPADGWQQS
jgi:hypothetical protein